MFHRLAWLTAAAPSLPPRTGFAPDPPAADAGTPVIWPPPASSAERLGHQVHALGAHHLCLDHTARARVPRASVKTTWPSVSGRLVRGAADRDLAVLVVDSTDSTSTWRVSPSRSSARCEVSSSASREMWASRSAMTSGVELVLVADGLGAVLVGVAEDADGVEPGAGEEAFQLGEVGLGLAGEADDEVGAGAGLRGLAADGVQQLQEAVGVAEAAHRAQHARARSAGRTGRSTGRPWASRSARRSGRAASRRAGGS